MARANQLKHFYYKNTALSYNSNDTPLNGPHWESGSRNVFTSCKYYTERAPGFTALETTPTTFTGNIVRVFTWEMWDGTFIVLCNEVYAGSTNVYKLKVGTDPSFVLLYGDSTWGAAIGPPWDFCISNNTLFFCNGKYTQKWDGASALPEPWGIQTAPMVSGTTGTDYARGRPRAATDVDSNNTETYATSLTVGATTDLFFVFGHGITDGDPIKLKSFVGTPDINGRYIATVLNATHLTIPFDSSTGSYSAMGTVQELSSINTMSAVYGYRYVYTYGNSTTNHMSSSSNPSVDTGVFTGMDHVTVSGIWSWDTQVDEVHVFRTTDGGGANYFELPNSPIANSVGWSIEDSFADEELSSYRAPAGVDLGNVSPYTPSGQNDAPEATPGYGPVWFANRIWYFKDNTLYYTAWEEMGDFGVEEECLPPTNYLTFQKQITGLASNDEFLLVFASNKIWKITGDSLQTFKRDPLFSNLGARNRACLATFGKSVAWFDTGHTVRITDGFQQKELSVDIRPDLSSISHETASLSFYSNGTTHFLALLDGTGGKMYVYDLDMEQWMPPWDHVGVARSLNWGEIASGSPVLLMGSAGKKVLKMTPAGYNVDGTLYTAAAKSNIVELVPTDQPDRLAYPQRITLERNAIALDDVLELRDENPDNGTYTSDFENLATNDDISPPLRPQGSNIVEEWFTTQQTACKRMSVQFQWAAEDSNFILYAFSIGYKELT